MNGFGSPSLPHTLVAALRGLAEKPEQHNLRGPQVETLRAAADLIDGRLSGVTLHHDSGTATVDGRVIRLTPSELRVFELLLNRQVATHVAIEHVLWGNDPNGGPRDARGVINILILHLRRKLQSSTLRIKNIWGNGYELIRRLEEHEDIANNGVPDSNHHSATGTSQT